MQIVKLTVGNLQSNCFIVTDEMAMEALVIDPGDEPDRILEAVRDLGCTVRYIVCTHGHFDHVGAVSDISDATQAKVVLHRDESEVYEKTHIAASLWGFDVTRQPEPDLYVNDGDTVSIGNVTFSVMHTPGHTPGGICLMGNGVIFTGDTLFEGSVGRTDFPGGDHKKLTDSFRLLMQLPDDTKVYAGHGPDTSIGREKRENFFLHCL